MSTSYTVARTAYSRVFVIEGRARGDHAPSYESCMRLTGLSQGFGDIEKIECPDPFNYGKFVEVAEIRGETERATASIEGRYAMELLSLMMKLARKGCSFDVQLHMGTCTDPSNFNIFTKSIILESAAITTYNTDDLGALSSGDNAAVNENADISAKMMYEVAPLVVAERAASIVTNEVIDVVVCDTASCGDCDEESDGCNKVFAITTAAGGSPSTAADIVYSIDAGVTWYAHDIDTLATAEAPNGVDCLGSYIVVVSNASDSLHYALKTQFDGLTDPAFTEVTTGIVAAGSPRNIWSSGDYFFVVGDSGYVYGSSDPTAGVSVLDAGSATADQLNCVHGLSSTFAVAVGNNGAVIYTEDGVTWKAATKRPVAVGINLNTVFVKSEKEWWVGSSGGSMYYTLDKGVTWTTKTFSGSAAGQVRDIVFATDSVGFMAHDTATPRARIFRTYDGGYSWNLIPESSGSMPLADRVNRIGYCTEANFVVGVGLGDNGTDGFIVTGKAS